MKNLNDQQFNELLVLISKEKIEIEFDEWDYTDSGLHVGSYKNKEYELETHEFLINAEIEVSQTFTIEKNNLDPFSFMANGKGGFCSVLYELFYGDEEYKFTIEQQIKASTAIQKIIE
jgi:hypothetical protein